MGCQLTTFLGLCGFLAVVISFALLIFARKSQLWAESDRNLGKEVFNSSYNFGLYEFCWKGKCVNVEDSPIQGHKQDLYTIQSCETAGTVCAGIALVISIWIDWQILTKTCLCLNCKALSFICGLLCFVSGAAFIAVVTTFDFLIYKKLENKYSSIGIAFYIGFVGTISVIITGILFFFLSKKLQPLVSSDETPEGSICDPETGNQTHSHQMTHTQRLQHQRQIQRQQERLHPRVRDARLRQRLEQRRQQEDRSRRRNQRGRGRGQQLERNNCVRRSSDPEIRLPSYETVLSSIMSAPAFTEFPELFFPQPSSLLPRRPSTLSLPPSYESVLAQPPATSTTTSSLPEPPRPFLQRTLSTQSLPPSYELVISESSTPSSPLTSSLPPPSLQLPPRPFFARSLSTQSLPPSYESVVAEMLETIPDNELESTHL